MPASPDITALLRASSEGDRQALDRLVPLVYEQLRVLARARLRHERRDHTLDTVALIHEAYLKLVQLDRLQWHDRAHFFAMASRLMRRILIDYAHRRNAAKREGRLARLDVSDLPIAGRGDRGEMLLALDAALTQLEGVSSRAARAIECRYFAGLSVEETAAALNVSPASVKRDLRFAHAWLARTMQNDTADGPTPPGTGSTPVPRDRRPDARRPRRAS